MANPRVSDVISELKTLMGNFADSRIKFEALASEYFLLIQAGDLEQVDEDGKLVDYWPKGHENYPKERLDAGIAALAAGIGSMTTEQKAAVSLAR